MPAINGLIAVSGTIIMLKDCVFTRFYLFGQCLLHDKFYGCLKIEDTVLT